MTTLSQKNQVLVLGLLLIAARILMYAFTGFTSDDAFITYRYAQNISEGKGFTYNEGEKVQGTSTPLFTLVLSVVSVAFGPAAIPAAARSIAVAADLGTLFLLVRICAPMGSASVFLAAALYALFPKVVLISVSGMETPIVVMLMILSFDCLRRNAIPAAMFVLGLMLIVRVDAAVWVLVVLAGMIWRRESPRLADLGITAAVAGSWFVFAALYFGSSLPHSVVAKNISWEHLFPVFDPLRVMLGYLPFQGLSGLPPPGQAVVVLLMFAPVIVVLIEMYRRKNLLIIFPLFFVTYNLFFAFARIVMADWYYLPGYAAYSVTVAGFLPIVARRVGLPDSGGTYGFGARVAIVALLLILLGIGTYRWKKNPGEWFLKEHTRVGRWLEANAPPGSSILLEPVGYIGWVSRLYVHDAVGLVSPRVIDYRNRFRGSDAWYAAYIHDMKPSFVLLQNREFDRNTLFLGHGDGMFRAPESMGWFTSQYRRVEFPPGSEWQEGPHFILFERIGAVE